MNRRIASALLALAATALTAAPAAATPVKAATEPRPTTPIEHFLFLMQGDRTFDNYFGTYPGANGIPAGTCQVFVQAKPANGCVKPFPAGDKAVPALAPGESVLKAQRNGGAMNGFVSAYVAQGRDGTPAMGYYDRSDLPFAWAAADKYVLFDRFFSSAFHGTRDNRSYWVSAAPAPGGTRSVPTGGYGQGPTIFDRLQAAGVSWKFYVQDYDPKVTFRSSPTAPAGQAVRVPLLDYARFVDDPTLASHIVDLSEYYKDLTAGTLPAVAYLASAGASERSSRSIPAAQDLLRDLTTQLMLSPYWRSSALMWSYDGSGGWYDHVAPPNVGGAQLGFRVPTLLVSPYARTGLIEHRQMEYPSALRFIEDNWQLAPLTERDTNATSIASVFDFSIPPRTPDLVTPVKAETGAVVEVTTAYRAYGLATAAALGLLVLAFAWPWVLLHATGRPVVVLRERTRHLRDLMARLDPERPVAPLPTKHRPAQVHTTVVELPRAGELHVITSLAAPVHSPLYQLAFPDGLPSPAALLTRPDGITLVEKPDVETAPDEASQTDVPKPPTRATKEES
jgi:phospholipase C